MLTNQLCAYRQIILLQSVVVYDVYRERMEITSNITIKMTYGQALWVYDLIFLMGVKDASNVNSLLTISNNYIGIVAVNTYYLQGGYFNVKKIIFSIYVFLKIKPSFFNISF